MLVALKLEFTEQDGLEFLFNYMIKDSNKI